MDKALFERLNAVYAPLRRRARELCGALEKAGVPAGWSWYACHSARIGGEWQMEEFPIPVVTAEGLCDVGFDLDGIFLEFQLPREAALTFDYRRLPEGFEAYGVERYLQDFYRSGMDMDGIARRIGESGERAVGIQLTFPLDTQDDTLLAAVTQCRRWRNMDEEGD